MNTRKNVTSYFLWLSFAIIALIGLILNISAYCISTYHTSISLTCGIICIYIVILLILYLLCRVIVEKVHDKHRNDRESKIEDDEYYEYDEEEKNHSLKVIIPVLVMFAGIAKIAYFVMKNTPLKLEATAYVRDALVLDQSKLQFAIHGLSDLYTRILRGLFLVFGNQTFAALTFHLILYFVVLFVIFLTIKQLAGFVCGIVAMIAFVALPISTEYCFTFSPELLFLLLYLIGLYVIGRIAESFRNGAFSSPKQCIPVMFFGIYIGFMTYLDLVGITLLLYVLWLFLLKEPKEKNRNIGYIILFEVIGIADALIIIAAVLELTGTVSLFEYLNQLGNSYFGELFFNTNFTMLIPDCTVGGSIAILTAGILSAPSFMVEKEDRCTPFILSFLLLSLLQLFHVGTKMNLDLMNAFFWCILAGVGVHGLLYFEDAVEINDIVEDVEELEEVEVPGVVIKEKEPGPGEPLPNPMQIPKKHMKKSYDYKIDVPEEQMKFDHDISDDSDFDLM